MAQILSPAPSGKVAIIHQDDAPARLAHLGLKVDHLTRAIELGDLGRRRCGPLHPRQAHGYLMWAETTAGLRQELMALQAGWKAGSTENFETVYHPDRKVAIAVVAGDYATGTVAFRHPRPKRRRGPAAIRRVSRNHVQLALPIFQDVEDHQPADLTCDTWFLLVHAAKDEIRSELSLPIGPDEWAERILLPSISIAGGVSPIDPDGETDDIPDITVGRRL